MNQGNPYLFESNWSQAQWVIVSQATGSRYFAKFDGSSIPFSAPDQAPGATVTIIGQTLSLEITDTELITWDAVAGNISEMEPGSMILYAANSFQTGHLKPERTQLLQHSGTMEGPPDDTGLFDDGDGGFL